MSSSTNIWFRSFNLNPGSKFRLFCFPYAGTGPVVFRDWHLGLSEKIDVWSILLPGRESRIRETPFLQLRPLIETLVHEFKDFQDQPFAFFGHSLGALIAFELTLQLRRQSFCLPTHLFLSGRRASGLQDPRPHIHNLDDDAFAEAIQQRYNGIPDIILQEPDLLDLFLPIIRADFSILETYEYTPEIPLEIPISVFGGLQDPAASRQELEAWKDFTTRKFDIHMFPGNHFFIQDHRRQLLEVISTSLKPHISNNGLV